MRTLSISALATLLVLSSCNITTDNGFPVNLIQKEGTGMIKNKVYTITFDEIRVAQSIAAEVVKSDEEKVVITAPADILDDIVVESTGGKLYIHFKQGLNISAKNVAAKIFAKDFSSIEASSSARITIKDKFTQDKTEVIVSSSGSIKGNLEANDLSIAASSSGSYSGQIWAVNLDAKASSSADIIISGKTKNANIQSSSSGTVNAKDVIAESAEVQASSSATVRLAVIDQLRASASSSGDVYIYKKGSLNVVNKKESSGGSIVIR